MKLLFENWRKHLKENGETYLSHLFFAGKIGLTLMLGSVIFILHAIFPICAIPKKWNLKGTIKKLQKWNEYAIRRKNK
jgi:hypothetical protein